MKTHLITATLAAALSLVLTTSHLLDHPGTDTEAEADADTLREAAHMPTLQARAEAMARRVDRIALQLCQEERGPQATAAWSADGELICGRQGHALQLAEVQQP